MAMSFKLAISPAGVASPVVGVSAGVAVAVAGVEGAGVDTTAGSVSWCRVLECRKQTEVSVPVQI
jgi:hypothetical protein